jgi:hypothetical protein
MIRFISPALSCAIVLLCTMASAQADQLEALVLTLWRRRGEAAAVAETTSQLQSMLTDPAALDAIEFYLPQFAHMLIQLGGASGDTWCRRSACAVSPPRCTLAAAKACLGSLPDAHPGDAIGGSAELEKFVLAASQMSVHFALQFFWIVYASLQEHCPKNAGSKRAIYKRHATATATATTTATANATATTTNHTRTGASRLRQRSALPGHPLQPWA